MIMGDFFNADVPGKDKFYFETRDVFLDCRGRVKIHESAHFGHGVKIITASHSNILGNASGIRDTKFVRTSVVIEKNVFVNAFAILYNTKIGKNSVVAAGTVVLGRNVAPNVMVMGNPAVVVARFVDGSWLYEREYMKKLQ